MNGIGQFRIPQLFLISLPLLSLQNIIQHILQLSKRYPIIPMNLNHLLNNVPNLLMCNLLYQLVQQLHVYGTILVVV